MRTYVRRAGTIGTENEVSAPKPHPLLLCVGRLNDCLESNYADLTRPSNDRFRLLSCESRHSAIGQHRTSCQRAGRSRLGRDRPFRVGDPNGRQGGKAAPLDFGKAWPLAAIPPWAPFGPEKDAARRAKQQPTWLERCL